MLLCLAEFTHASDKFEFTTKEFGASGAGRSLHRCRCPYHFDGWAAVANQLAAAWMWLTGAIPLSTVHSNLLLYFSVILRNPWFSLGFIISVSEKRMKNCIVKNIDNAFEKMTKVGYFLWGRRHEVLFVGDGFMGTEVHLPPKFSFFSDFGHLIFSPRALLALLPVRGNLRVKQLLISVRWRVCRKKTKKYSREWCDPIFFFSFT